ncbi:hypothetical protein IW261DRAFT_1497226 [Armillaria novae-zelandiae]|uniref:Uncharacterized protein n=1 Tax=Armillaria novae-zelandiae TaxID=153914 RepID=A0AA39NZM1_9AGAR|nr:hypothetical protein IW261DRAFT_1497226 [Armillaria novae-zelandiae]
MGERSSPCVLPGLCLDFGTSLLNPDAIDIMVKDLFSLATLITPNKSEAQLLLAHGRPGGVSRNQYPGRYVASLQGFLHPVHSGAQSDLAEKRTRNGDGIFVQGIVDAADSSIAEAVAKVGFWRRKTR